MNLSQSRPNVNQKEIKTSLVTNILMITLIIISVSVLQRIKILRHIAYNAMHFHVSFHGMFYTFMSHSSIDKKMGASFEVFDLFDLKI